MTVDTKLYHDATYYCDKCKQHRRLKFNTPKHENLMGITTNGLVLYSDVHRCIDGLLEVNNLNVDKNYHIRTFEFLKLPEYRRKTTSMIPMPGLKKKEDDHDSIKIMEVGGEDSLNILIEDFMLNTTIRIGRFDFNQEITHTFESEMMGLNLHYYKSSIDLNDTLKMWLQFFIDTLEILPPTKLGMLLETLKYVLEQHSKPPSDFDKKFIRTILASHEIFFDVKDIAKVMNLYEKYGEAFSKDDFDFIDQFLSTIQEHEQMPIQFFTKKNDKDLIYQIYLFLILEKEDIIRIERPGIVEHV